jgi:hypothetical protein
MLTVASNNQPVSGGTSQGLLNPFQLLRSEPLSLWTPLVKAINLLVVHFFLIHHRLHPPVRGVQRKHHSIDEHNVKREVSI